MKLNRSYLRRLIKEAVLNEDDVVDRMLGKVSSQKKPSSSDVSSIADLFSEPESGVDLLTTLANQQQKKDSDEAYEILGTLKVALAIVKQNAGDMAGASLDAAAQVSSDIEDAIDILENQPNSKAADVKGILSGLIKSADELELSMEKAGNDIIYDGENYTSEFFNMIDSLAKHPKINIKTPRQSRKEDVEAAGKAGAQVGAQLLTLQQQTKLALDGLAKRLKKVDKTRYIQSLLKTLLEHYDLPDIKVDGEWGPKTDQALLKVMTHGGSWARGKKTWKDAAKDSGGKYKPTMSGLTKFLQDQVKELNSQTDPTKEKKKEKTIVGKDAQKEIQKEFLANKEKLRKLLRDQSFDKLDNSQRKKLAQASASKSNKIVVIKPFDANAKSFANNDIESAGGKVSQRAITDDGKTLVVIGDNQLNESLRMSRGSLYRQRYRRY